MKMQLTQHRSFQSLAEFWQARNPRERTMLTLAAAFLVLALFYLVLIEPALNGREQLSRSVPQLRQQVAEMQTLAKEAATLPQPSQQTRPALTQQEVAAGLSNHGLNAQNLTVSGQMVRVQLSNSSFASLLAWLSSVRSAAMLEVSEVNIVALSQPGMVNGTITLRQQASE